MSSSCRPRAVVRTRSPSRPTASSRQPLAPGWRQRRFGGPRGRSSWRGSPVANVSGSVAAARSSRSRFPARARSMHGWPSPRPPRPRPTRRRVIHRTARGTAMRCSPGARAARARRAISIGRGSIARPWNVLARCCASPCTAWSCPGRGSSTCRRSRTTSARWSSTTWNRTAVGYRPEATVHALFREQAASHPERIAIAWDGGRLDYGQLDRWSDALAERLIAAGVDTDQPVALCMERCPEALVAALAIMKAGGAYLPLDPITRCSGSPSRSPTPARGVLVTSRARGDALARAGVADDFRRRRAPVMPRRPSRASSGPRRAAAPT